MGITLGARGLSNIFTEYYMVFREAATLSIPTNIAGFEALLSSFSTPGAFVVNEPIVNYGQQVNSVFAGPNWSEQSFQENIRFQIEVTEGDETLFEELRNITLHSKKQVDIIAYAFIPAGGYSAHFLVDAPITMPTATHGGSQLSGTVLNAYVKGPDLRTVYYNKTYTS
jgi:hypothetical protein